MFEGFPLPDFDFDEAPPMEFEKGIIFSAPIIFENDLKNISEEINLIFFSEKPICSTSNSSVYRVIDQNNNEYAIKISKHKNRILKEFKKRNELPITKYLVESYEIYQLEKYSILQMEFCNGGDILGKKFKEEEIWYLIYDISSALSILHNDYWIHLDVSPSNILIHDNIFKLTDFGTVIKIGEFQPGDEGAGPYVSPEVIDFSSYEESDNIDYSTDIFSFGIVLLVVASGLLAPS